MVKTGIIGYGYMGHFHLEKIKGVPQAEVTGVFDTDQEKLKQAESDGLRSFAALEDFLRSDMELVIIATPNQWHARYAIAAMQAGKHVMCEKPAVMTVKEMEQVMQCARETGKIFTVHQQRRWDPDFRIVCDVVRSGNIGNVTTIESRVLGERGVCFGWRADPASGGGMLYDWGAHLIDQILQLYPDEKVNSIYARIRSVLTPAVDDFFELVMLLGNGVCAKISVGTFALQKLPRWFVFGDRGTMKLDDFTGRSGGIARIKGEVKGFESVADQPGPGPSRTMAPLRADQTEPLDMPAVNHREMAYWENLIRAVRGLEEPYVTPEQILRQIRIIEAAFDSAKRNEVLKVSI